MEELLRKAKEFLDTNWSVNEVELSDGFGNRVRLVRYTPVPTIFYPSQYQYQYTYPVQH